MLLAEIHKEDLYRYLTEEHFDAFMYDELLYLPHALLEVFEWAEKNRIVKLSDEEEDLFGVMLEAESSIYEQPDPDADEQFLESVLEDALTFLLSSQNQVEVQKRLDSYPTFRYSLTMLDKILVEVLGKGNGKPKDDLTQEERFLFYIAQDRPGFDLVEYIVRGNISMILRQELDAQYLDIDERLERVLCPDDSLESWKTLTIPELCLIGLCKVEEQMRALNEISTYLKQHPEARDFQHKAQVVNFFWLSPKRLALESFEQKFSRILKDHSEAIQQDMSRLRPHDKNDLVKDLQVIERDNYWPVYMKLRGE